MNGPARLGPPITTMADRLTLVGLDFGTTTSSAVVATAALLRNAVSGRTELSDVRERFRSDMVFTPLDGDRLDIVRAEAYLNAWLADGGVRTEEVFGGGALLTGLTAQRDNAARLVELIRRRFGDTLIAAADDPCLESWLAFLGSCAELSRLHRDRAVLNLDVGGGTTNLALGRDGQVRRTGCLLIGARHVQVAPGSYRIVRLSRYARDVLVHLAIGKGEGDRLTDADVATVLDYWVGLLEATVAGDLLVFRNEPAQGLVQVPFQRPGDTGDPIVTLSGGVGELVYAHLRGAAWPPTTHFGDLGIDLARRLLQSERLGRDLRTHVPAGGGRATVYGLLRHSTEVSGSTLFLPRPEVLPLPDLPVLGRVALDTSDADLRDLLDRVARSPRGGCLFVSLAPADGAALRSLGGRLAAALGSFPAGHPLVLLVPENLGKVLGHYATDWGRRPLTLVVLDEVAVKGAQYVQIGRLHQQVVPVSFYGLHEPGDTPCPS
jgi:ethanolamine utilization protein EutA